MASLHILIVDDCTVAASSMARLLQHYGHHIQLAQDGQTAIEMARAEQPDVVLLDIGLPDMDGYEVVRHLGEGLFDKPPLVIAMSGYVPDSAHSHCEDSVIDMYLVKPVDPLVLMNILSRFARVVACCP